MLESMARSFGTAMSAVSAEPPTRAEIDRQLQVRADAKSRGHPLGGLELAHVPLPVADAQRVEREALGLRASPRPCTNRGRRTGAQRLVVRSSLVGRSEVRPYVLHFALRTLHFALLRLPACPGSQMYLCSWSWTRTGRRSARTHSLSVRESSTPCTGENRTAETFAVKRVTREDVPCVLVVRAILDHELHFVVRAPGDRGWPSPSGAPPRCRGT